jgi:hypothetical protein
MARAAWVSGHERALAVNREGEYLPLLEGEPRLRRHRRTTSRPGNNRRHRAGRSASAPDRPTDAGGNTTDANTQARSDQTSRRSLFGSRTCRERRGRAGGSVSPADGTTPGPRPRDSRYGQGLVVKLVWTGSSYLTMKVTVHTNLPVATARTGTSGISRNVSPAVYVLAVQLPWVTCTEPSCT